MRKLAQLVLKKSPILGLPGNTTSTEKEDFSRNQNPTLPSYFFPNELIQANGSASMTQHEILEQSAAIFPQNKCKGLGRLAKPFNYT